MMRVLTVIKTVANQKIYSQMNPKCYSNPKIFITIVKEFKFMFPQNSIVKTINIY